MKKSCVSFITVLLILLFSGCNSNHDTNTVKNGTYVMELEDSEAVLLPRIIISDDEIIFAFDLLISYLPHGTYSIEDDILTMTTDDDKYIYVFQIDGDDLVFQKDKSSTVRVIDERLEAKVTDKAKFHLKDE